MPMTATMTTTDEVLDATSISEELWQHIHRPRGRGPRLTCPSCREDLIPVDLKPATRFFRHHTEAPSDCASAGETPEHRRLKLLLAETIRALGHSAVVEARPASGDHGGWRADILAITADGFRCAFEVQLSPMSDYGASERTQRYAKDGIGVLWVSSRQARPWFGQAPSIQIEETNSEWSVVDGLVTLDPEVSVFATTTQSLPDFVGNVLDRTVRAQRPSSIPTTDEYVYRYVSKHRWPPDGYVWHCIEETNRLADQATEIRDRKRREAGEQDPRNPQPPAAKPRVINVTVERFWELWRYEVATFADEFPTEEEMTKLSELVDDLEYRLDTVGVSEAMANAALGWTRALRSRNESVERWTYPDGVTGRSFTFGP
jgi:hypothetical protein